MLILLILLAVPLCFFEGIPLVKQKKWRDLIAFGILVGLAIFIGIGKTLGLPTPIELLQQWALPLGKAIFKPI